MSSPRRYDRDRDRDRDRDGPVPLECKVYVGELSSSVSKRDIEDAFGEFGPLHNIWIAKSPPGFGFVEFEDPRDAEDACYGLDGKMLGGRRIRVELSNGRHKRKMGRGRGRPYDPDDKCYSCGERGHYAYDCRKFHTGGMPGYGRYSRSRSRSYSRSRSRSRGRKEGGRKRGRSYSRSPSPRDRGDRGDRGHRSSKKDYSRSRSRSAKRSYSRSPTPHRRSKDSASRSRSRSR